MGVSTEESRAKQQMSERARIGEMYVLCSCFLLLTVSVFALSPFYLFDFVLHLSNLPYTCLRPPQIPPVHHFVGSAAFPSALGIFFFCDWSSMEAAS